MSISTEIDLGLLRQFFELKPYGDLLRVDKEAAAAAEVAMTCNAFCVAVFCIEETFESRSVDFLHAAFALYPNLEYAIITLPHTVPEFSLLNSFSQVEPVPSSFGHTLHVFHRDALAGDHSLSVRPADLTNATTSASLIPPVQLNNPANVGHAGPDDHSSTLTLFGEEAHLRNDEALLEETSLKLEELKHKIPQSVSATPGAWQLVPIH